MLSKWYAYFLELGGGYYYVGISQNPARRIYAHKNNAGSRLSKKYGVQSVIGIWELGIMDANKAMLIEDNITKCLHYVYGDKVRGGSYCMEDVYYMKNGMGLKYLEKFKEVTEEVMRELNLMELRGWG